MTKGGYEIKNVYVNKRNSLISVEYNSILS